MRRLLPAITAIALASATALAQNASPNNPGATDKLDTPATQGGVMEANPSRTAQTAKQEPNFAQVLNTDMLSSNVVGLDIYNSQNDKVGKIQDIAFNTSKEVTGYILSVGGFLGMGTHYVAVNPSSLMVSYDASNKVWRATMNATKEQLKSTPEFKYSGQWTASRS